MDTRINLSRRAFFSGHTAIAAPEGMLRAAIGPACLAHAGVVCRTCGDLCEAGAIRFRPRLGEAALPEVDLGRCTGCNDCRTACPTQAISLIPVSQEKQ